MLAHRLFRRTGYQSYEDGKITIVKIQQIAQDGTITIIKTEKSIQCQSKLFKSDN